MSKTTDLNAREQLLAAASWLGYQHEDLSFGLRSPGDGLKLWKAWTSDQTLPEFCDEAESPEDGRRLRARVVQILRYDPWKRAAMEPAP
jgi:hypothetical protein